MIRNPSKNATKFFRQAFTCPINFFYKFAYVSPSALIRSYSKFFPIFWQPPIAFFLGNFRRMIFILLVLRAHRKSAHQECLAIARNDGRKAGNTVCLSAWLSVRYDCLKNTKQFFRTVSKVLPSFSLCDFSADFCGQTEEMRRPDRYFIILFK